VLRDRPVTYEVRVPPLIRVDEVLFDAIVSNILNNVVDHTPPDTNVAISARRSGDSGVVVVTIEDDGPGVADADLARIFDKFQRTRPPGEGARRGMGVGLSIVRGMADAIGGTATAHRSKLGGLAISLELPAAPAPPDDDVDR
jgi:signal transduction histidine kinase